MTIARGVASFGGRSKSLFGACVLVFLMIGCSEPLGPEQDDLAEAVARWEVADLEDYVFEFQRLCFCGGDVIRRVRIVVRSGSVTAATYVDDGAPVSGDLEDVPTIETLFEEIQDAIDREAHVLTASYHAALGYPTAVSIDYIENAVDEEMAFNVYSLDSPGTARRDSPLPRGAAGDPARFDPAQGRGYHERTARTRTGSGPAGNRIRGHPREENSLTRRFLAASLALPLAFAGARGLEAQTDPKIFSAESAAPESIAREATVMDVDQTVLREGTNGWTCLPDFPDTLGSDPMCLDAPWMEWFRAYMSNTPPNISGIGFGYMLGGDAAASNTDPFATAPTDSNEWMSYGSPHIMMIVPEPSMLEGIPTSHSAGGPWVMWRDTPFAHVMLPVAEPGQYIMAH